VSERRVQVTVPEPYEDVPSLYRSVLALKELAEMMAGQRGAEADRAVTWGELPVPYGGDQGWSPLPFLNGWGNYGSAYGPCAFRKLSTGLVLLRGLTTFGTAIEICQLPPGYRPGAQLLLAAEASPNVLCRLDLRTDGTLYHTGGTSGWISLNNICFLAEY
jgi:hypothetical protein